MNHTSTDPTMSISNASVSPHLLAQLERMAIELDQEQVDSSAVLLMLATDDVFRLGVKPDLGGQGTFADAFHAVVAVAQRSLSAAFMFWAQRAFIECVVSSTQESLQQQLLSRLFKGELAGAVGLSNAIKFLGGLEPLGIAARQQDEGIALTGSLPWVTNVPRGDFMIALAAQMPDQTRAVWVVHSQDAGLERLADLDLIALRGSNTAAFNIKQLLVKPSRKLSDNAATFISQLRPRFLALQCAMGVGVARACLQSIQIQTKITPLQRDRAQQMSENLDTLTMELMRLAAHPDVLDAAPGVFRIRVALGHLVSQASALEITSIGGAVYLNGMHPQTLRRQREASFIPLITPSVAQLELQLASAR